MANQLWKMLIARHRTDPGARRLPVPHADHRVHRGRTSGWPFHGRSSGHGHGCGQVAGQGLWPQRASHHADFPHRSDQQVTAILSDGESTILTFWRSSFVFTKVVSQWPGFVSKGMVRRRDQCAVLFLDYLLGARAVLASCSGLEASDQNTEGEKLTAFFHLVSTFTSTLATFRRFQNSNRRHFTKLFCRMVSAHPLNSILRKR